MSFEQSSPAQAKHSLNPTHSDSENACVNACVTKWHPSDAKYPLNAPERNSNAIAEGGGGCDAYALFAGQGSKQGMNDGGVAKAVLAGDDGAVQSAREMSRLGFPMPDLVGEEAGALSKGAESVSKGAESVSKGEEASKDGDAANKEALAFCSIEDRALTPDRQARGERALGRAVMEHLKDQDWLIEHQAEVRRAIGRAWMEVGMSEFKSFMDEIAKKSDGNLYCVRGNGLLGSLNPLNPPGDLVWRVYLKRGILHPDTLLLDSRTQTQCSA